MSIRKLLLKTPLAQPLKEVESYLHKKDVHSFPDNIIQKHRTVYCISPYKTGTTFLATSYDQKKVQHEPMQYFTLKNIDNQFDTLFIKRLNALNLKMECSGFLSAYVEELSRNQLTKSLNYVCITRPPSKWITSVVNYWDTLKFLNFDYINQLFWEKKVGVDLIHFIKKNEDEKAEIIDKLISFYFGFTKKLSLLQNIHFIDIKKLNNYLDVLDRLINEKHFIESVNKRENSEKKFKYENDEIDFQYASLINEISH